LRLPTSSSSYFRLGGTIRSALANFDFRLGAALAGLDVRLCGVARSALAGFDVRPIGALCATTAGSPLGVGPDGRRCAALTGDTSTLLCSSQLGLQGPPCHRFSELYGFRL